MRANTERDERDEAQTREQVLEATQAEREGASDERLARLLENANASTTSELDTLALTSFRVREVLAEELLDRGRRDLVVEVLEEGER
jgi:hypothetical protein